MEVSPFYFEWAQEAVNKYYHHGDDLQQTAHRELLEAVRKDISASNLAFDSNTSSNISDYARRFAGDPIMYGVCLQKQHLDARHYPKRLTIRNGNAPFLYSLIGSWGPMLFGHAHPVIEEAVRNALGNGFSLSNHLLALL
jgi:hypothetical protein